MAGLDPGDTLDLGWQTLDNGASYQAMIQRYDNDWSGIQTLFALTVEGRGAGPAGGQRVISFGLTNNPISISLEGAFVLNSDFEVGIGGGVVVDGNDSIPPGWGGDCDPPGPAKPGLVTDDLSKIDAEGSPTFRGDPPILVAPFDTLAFDVLFDELVAIADHTFPVGVQLDESYQIEPVKTGGICDTSVPTNWGAPEDPNHPCFDYFPIIYAPGGFNFKTQPDHAGQGIILVDEEAQLENGFSWYGLIMARGDIQVEQGKSGYEPSYIYGGLYTRNDMSDTKLAGPMWYDSIGGPPWIDGPIKPKIVTPHIDVPGSQLHFSSCAMKRVEMLSSIATNGAVERLTSRAWGQALR